MTQEWYKQYDRSFGPVATISWWLNTSLNKSHFILVNISIHSVEGEAS